MGDLRVPDLNTVTIAGRLTRDPELKYLASGRGVCTFSIANTQYYKDKSGERKENTTFVDVTLWDKAAEYAGQNYAKGTPVLVEGRLKSDSWEDKTSGQKRSKVAINAVRVSALEWGDRGEGGSGGSYDGGGYDNRSEKNERPTRTETHYDDGSPIPEDDIPF